MSLSLGAPFLFIDVAKVVQSVLAYTDVVFCCHLLFISFRVCALKCMQIRLLSAVDVFYAALPVLNCLTCVDGAREEQ